MKRLITAIQLTLWEKRWCRISLAVVLIALFLQLIVTGRV